MTSPHIPAMPERAKIAMSLIRKAAANGKSCPTNHEIACAMGCASMSAGANIISFLETCGIITVERGQDKRVVIINATGQRTHGEIAKTGNFKPAKQQNIKWSCARDNILMEAMANGLDFENASHLTGIPTEECAARFDLLCSEMGTQAA